MFNVIATILGVIMFGVFLYLAQSFTARIKTKPRLYTALKIFLVLIFVAPLIMVGFMIFSGRTVSAPSKTSVPTATLSCTLKCDIGIKSYSFDVTCESGSVSNELGNSTNVEYDPSGQISKTSIDVDQKLTWRSSGNIYHMVGTIVVHPIAGYIDYDIRATGGVFGDTPKTCKNGETNQANPISTLTPISSTPAPTPLTSNTVVSPGKTIVGLWERRQPGTVERFNLQNDGRYTIESRKDSSNDVIASNFGTFTYDKNHIYSVDKDNRKFTESYYLDNGGDLLVINNQVKLAWTRIR